MKETIIGAIGILLGWGLNQFGDFWKLKRDDRRVLKDAVFNLLEVYFMVTRANYSKGISFFDDFFDEVINQKGVDFDGKEKEAKDLFRGLMKPIALKSTLLYLKTNVEKIEQSYSKTIIDLSKVDPVAAYDLSAVLYNIKQVLELPSTMKILSEDFEQIGVDASKNNADFFEVYAPKVLSESINETKDAILEIAKKIGGHTEESCADKILEIENSMTLEIEIKLKETIQPLIDKMII